MLTPTSYRQSLIDTCQRIIDEQNKVKCRWCGKTCEEEYCDDECALAHHVDNLECMATGN